MAIVAYGKRFSWEDSLFYHGYKHDDIENHIRILGHKSNGLRFRAPDTAPEADFTRSSGVYLLHAPDGEIVYVGQAKQLGSRLIAHSGDHLRDRWTHYSWFATSAGLTVSESNDVGSLHIEHVDAHNPQPSLSLDTLEAILRTTIEPRYNLQSGRWRGVPQFAQSVEYRFMYLREVYEQNKRIKKLIKKMAV